MDKSSLGDRQKGYEEVCERYLIRRMPVIMRLDGRSFTKWTKGLKRPFDDDLRQCMEYATFKLCEEVSNCRYGYTQSDEISLLLIDYQDHNTQPWFKNRVDKMIASAATICSNAFNVAAMKYLPEHWMKRGPAAFDARVFNIPRDDVSNNFLWRQRDCTRNSILSVAHANFSHNQMHKKNTDELQDMLFKQKGINWDKIPTRYKRGVSFKKVEFQEKTPKGQICLRTRWVKNYEMPIISKMRVEVEQWLQEDPNLTYVEEGSELLHHYTCEEIDLKTLLKCPGEVV